jgi:hypothetical protein
VFRIPFPLYDPANPLHTILAAAAAHAEAVVASLILPATSFQSQRRRVREALTEDGVAATLDSHVADLLS